MSESPTASRFCPIEEYRRWLHRWLAVGFNGEWPQTFVPGGINPRPRLSLERRRALAARFKERTDA